MILFPSNISSWAVRHVNVENIKFYFSYGYKDGCNLRTKHTSGFARRDSRHRRVFCPKVKKGLPCGAQVVSKFLHSQFSKTSFSSRTSLAVLCFPPFLILLQLPPVPSSDLLFPFSPLEKVSFPAAPQHAVRLLVFSFLFSFSSHFFFFFQIFAAIVM